MYLRPGLLSSSVTAFEMRQVAFEMYEVAFEMHLLEIRRQWNFWPGGDPPHQHVSNALYGRAESVSLGPVLLILQPIIVEMYQVVFEMYRVTFEMYLRIPRSK